MEQRELNSLSMEVLPVSSTHFIGSPQIERGVRSDPFACDCSGRRFKAVDLRPSAPPAAPSPSPPKTAPPRKKDKVVFVLGTTGAGKSKLAIDLAAHFGGEVINSDKMQVYDGLSVITNKVTDEERAGVPHHLIGGVHPDADFTAADFRREAVGAVESIVARGRLPIVAGGSNSYIEELVDGDGGKFRSMYDCFFLWIDVELPVLHRFVDARVDKMVEMGLVEEARGVFDPEADYTRGVRRSIGVGELDRYFRAAASDEGAKAEILKEAIGEVKANTRELTCKQLEKIRRFSTLPGWDVARVEATEAFLKRGEPDAEMVWIRVAREPSLKLVEKFLDDDNASIFKKANAVAPVAAASSAGAGAHAINVGGGNAEEHKKLPPSPGPPACNSESGQACGSLSGPLVS